MGDIIIRYVRLPASIRAYTLTDNNDDYNVYVNSALNSIERQKAIDHEIRHINGEHFFRATSVTTDEKEAENSFSKAVKAPAVKVKPVEIKPNPRKDFKAKRTAKGLTQHQLAMLAGVRRSVYAQYELGTRQCTKEDEEKILTALGEGLIL